MTVSQSASGEPVEQWSALATCWASVAPVRGDERFSHPQLLARSFTVFRVRWASTVSDLTPLDRISYGGRVFDIQVVREIGRREGLEIDAVVRADVTLEDSEDVQIPLLDFSEAQNSGYVGQVI